MTLCGQIDALLQSADIILMTRQHNKNIIDLSAFEARIDTIAAARSVGQKLTVLTKRFIEYSAELQSVQDLEIEAAANIIQQSRGGRKWDDRGESPSLTVSARPSHAASNELNPQVKTSTKVEASQQKPGPATSDQPIDDSCGNNLLAEWTTVRRKKVQKPIRDEVSKPGQVAIPDTNLSLLAISVATFDKVGRDGSLYYVEPAQHFAMYICGHLYHGNIGRIFTDSTEQPLKIKNCKFLNGCTKKDCDYYHDPTRPGRLRADVRNYVASSAVYVAPTVSKPMHYGTRYGSRSHLEYDLASLCSDDVDKYLDRIFHDLLCSLLLQGASS